MATLNCNYVMQIIALFLCVTILPIKLPEVWPFAAKAFDGGSSTVDQSRNSHHIYMFLPVTGSTRPSTFNLKNVSFLFHPTTVSVDWKSAIC